MRDFLAGTVACALFLGAATASFAAESGLKIGLLKYNGGGDWYSGGRALANLLRYAESSANVNFDYEPKAVEPSSNELFSYPITFINGHGNVSLNESEVANLRAYFNAGGFLFANDDYGMDASFRREMKKVLPEAEWFELPFNHPIYNTVAHFSSGLPKVHEHDNKPAQGFGLFVNGVMVCFYNYECDLCDGWEAEEIHNDPADKRKAALDMGTNVLVYALTRGVE
ncbi:MAG: DUF4159 domain-containing protein [bacterium]|nr:DUF4159 domain-containing protein [bacterium]